MQFTQHISSATTTNVTCMLHQSSQHKYDGEDAAVKDFLDADIAVLAKDREAYSLYAACIRLEYGHVPRNTYLTER